MEQSSRNSNTPLLQASSTLSDISFGSNSTIVASPASPASHRPGYRRVPSAIEENVVHSASSISSPPSKEALGLGITNFESHEDEAATQGPLSDKNSRSAFESADPLVSPASIKLGAGFPYGGKSQHPRDEERCVDNSSTAQLFQPLTAETDHHKAQSEFENKSFPCRSQGPLETGRGSWVAVTILVLSIYSTVFSLLWLILAIARPRYGHAISPVGKVGPIAASILYAAFAKSIELSFVTVFVALLGQILSKRALGDQKSVTIAEMSMRSWVLQPGTMITHWQSMRYAVITRLGSFAILGAIMAMIYTTASDALVAPKLQLGKAEDRLIYGKVSASFGNQESVANLCPTPIKQDDDPENGNTCIQIQHSGEAYHNYIQYLGAWREHIAVGNGSADLMKRPDPVGMLYDNTSTTVKGQWIKDNMSMTELSKNYNRTANNITMAMPHSGIVAAARDPLNGIAQPHDANGLSEYYINASVPSPMVNVLCADLSEVELKPMVYSLWPEQYRNDMTMPNSTNWPNHYELSLPEDYPEDLRITHVDDLFGFNASQVHPIFPKLPDAYNTVLNNSNMYGPESIFVLAASKDKTYTMCSLRAALYPNCSTRYHVTVGGGALSVDCHDPNDRLAYNMSHPEAPNGAWQKDWKDVASEWAMSLSLNAGISDGKSTNARLLSQMIPKTTALDPTLPSISEALAVLAGNTLLRSALNSPFIHYWNYSEPALKDPQYQAFNATLRTLDYQSGGTQPWQGTFYVVLAVVFVANLCCLIYFLVSGGLMTDFIEPQNLFCLALLSPPSEDIAGACGGGPDNEQFSTAWNVKFDRQHEHFWIESSTGQRRAMLRHKRNRSSMNKALGYEMQERPLSRAYSRIRKNRASVL